MTVYDFDKTIYDGHSTMDFFLFLLKKNWRLIRFVPLAVSLTLRYRFRLITEQDFFKAAERCMQAVVQEEPDIERLVKEFWDHNEHKIKDFYLKQKKPDDLIISGSLEFLLDEICSRLGVRDYIGSRLDWKECSIEFLCYHQNKVAIFHERFPGAVADVFYTDSLLDLPMMQEAKTVYMVHKNRIRLWNKGKQAGA
jgi:phosphoserine phosphatase